MQSGLKKSMLMWISNASLLHASLSLSLSLSGTEKWHDIKAKHGLRTRVDIMTFTQRSVQHHPLSLSSDAGIVFALIKPLIPFPKLILMMIIMIMIMMIIILKYYYYY